MSKRKSDGKRKEEKKEVNALLGQMKNRKRERKNKTMNNGGQPYMEIDEEVSE